MHKKICRTLVQRMRHDVAIGNASIEGDLLGMRTNTKHQEQKSTKFPSEQAHFGGFTNAWRVRGTATICITGGERHLVNVHVQGLLPCSRKHLQSDPQADQEPSD